jgi:prophage tail gpP-like protein
MQAVVETRQTAYDAHSHAVSIQGVGIQWFTWRGAVGIQSKDQNYPGGFRDVATAVLAEFGKTPVFIGDVDNTEFKPPAHNNPGQSVFQFLKDLAVQRKVVLGSDHLGNLLFIGDHSGGIVDTLTEGKNIISCQCVIKIADLYQPYVVKAQTMRSDDGTPADAAMQKAERDSTVLRTYSPLLVVLPHPVWTQPEVELAVEAEREWGDGTFIEVTVVVYGWFTSHGVLWLQAVGQKVIFNSPMTTLVNESLAIKSATCTQDRESGSRTTLVLVAPWLLNDHGVRMSSVQPDPSKAATTKPTQDQQPADSTSSLQPNLLQPSGIQE